MTSSINPNNIDGAYPIAGQDNNSQGFRDNFTNTKTNFQYAAAEITDLQNKAVLKAALTGTVLNNDMGGSVLSNAQIQDFSATYVNLGTVGSITPDVTINYAAGHYQAGVTGGSISLGFTNFPAAGIAGWVSVQIYISNIAHTVTLPAAVSIGNVGLLGLDDVTNTITFPQVGYYTFSFSTVDGGSAIVVKQENIQFQPLNNSKQILASGTAVSLATSISYFTTSGASTATLADGVEGQIKVLAAKNVSLGTMVVTVTSHAWSGAGTISFNSTGSACTLQFIDDEWQCIGNNAAIFA
jgi:hypothetical protein